nr:hypothetical protein [Tanacetum cinerariifolium]
MSGSKMTITLAVDINKMRKLEKWQTTFDSGGKVFGFQKAIKLIMLGKGNLIVQGISFLYIVFRSNFDINITTSPSSPSPLSPSPPLPHHLYTAASLSNRPHHHHLHLDIIVAAAPPSYLLHPTIVTALTVIIYITTTTINISPPRHCHHHPCVTIINTTTTTSQHQMGAFGSGFSTNRVRLVLSTPKGYVWIWVLAARATQRVRLFVDKSTKGCVWLFLAAVRVFGWAETTKGVFGLTETQMGAFGMTETQQGCV